MPVTGAINMRHGVNRRPATVGFDEVWSFAVRAAPLPTTRWLTMICGDAWKALDKPNQNHCRIFQLHPARRFTVLISKSK